MKSKQTVLVDGSLAAAVIVALVIVFVRSMPECDELSARLVEIQECHVNKDCYVNPEMIREEARARRQLKEWCRQ